MLAGLIGMAGIVGILGLERFLARVEEREALQTDRRTRDLEISRALYHRLMDAARDPAISPGRRRELEDAAQRALR